MNREGPASYGLSSFRYPLIVRAVTLGEVDARAIARDFVCDFWRELNREEHAMKLTSALVEQTLDQFEAQAIPDNHPVVPQLNELFGEHTFFVNNSGLHIVEPIEPIHAGSQEGTVINLADWKDPDRTSLAPHEPKATDVVVVLGLDDDEPSS
jgi:hypothetical protein